MKTKVLTLGIALALGLTSTAFAQNTTAKKNSEPKEAFDAAGTLTNALKPIAGKKYTYGLTAAGYLTGSTIHWIATQEQNLLDAFAGTGIIATDNTSLIVSASTEYNNSKTVTAPANTVDIKWSSKIMTSVSTTNPLFVAAKVEDCSNNIKVFNIQPVNGFIVDIKNIENETFGALNYDATDNQCYAKVASAKWDGSQMVYDYGQNVLYYEVVAANFSDEWVPTFQIEGLKAGQTATLEWSYNPYTSEKATTIDYAANAISSTLTTNAVKVETGTTTSYGVSIFVKVTVKNNNYEGTSDDDIILSVTGTVNDGAQKDQLATGGDSSFADNNSTQSFTKRPTLTAKDTAVPFSAEN